MRRRHLYIRCSSTSVFIYIFNIWFCEQLVDYCENCSDKFPLDNPRSVRTPTKKSWVRRPCRGGGGLTDLLVSAQHGGRYRVTVARNTVNPSKTRCTSPVVLSRQLRTTPLFTQNSIGFSTIVVERSWISKGIYQTECPFVLPRAADNYYYSQVSSRTRIRIYTVLQCLSSSRIGKLNFPYKPER